MQSGPGRHGHSLGCSPHSPPAVWLEELAEVAGGNETWREAHPEGSSQVQ